MIYLDNAATSYPKPSVMINSFTKSIKTYGGNPGRGGHKISMKTAEMVYDVRNLAAKMFASSPENIVFTLNCTHALNLAIKGIVSQGDHLIISNFEHNSVLRPVHALSLSGRATYSIAVVNPRSAEKTAASFERLIRKNTRAIICTHASNVTGDILPIKEISEVAKHYGINLIVDTAQTAGILPINIDEMGIDVLCCAGHKGLYGPSGTGLMILRNDDTKLSTLIQGGTGSNSIEFEQPEFSPDRFETGTINTAGIYALGESIKHIQKKGVDKIYKKEFSLIHDCFIRLKRIGKVILYDNEYIINKKVPVLPFNIEGLHSDETAAKLNKMNIAIRGGLQCAPLTHQFLGTLENGIARVSPGIYNKTYDIDYFISVIRRICK